MNEHQRLSFEMLDAVQPKIVTRKSISVLFLKQFHGPICSVFIFHIHDQQSGSNALK